MKHICTMICTVMLAGLLVLPACNRQNEGQVRAAPEDRADVTKQQRDDYVKTVNAKLAEFDQKFDGLDARAKGMTGTAKADFENSISGLRDERKVVAKKLDDLKSVSINSWTSLKNEVDTAITNLERSYEQTSAAHEKPKSSY